MEPHWKLKLVATSSSSAHVRLGLSLHGACGQLCVLCVVVLGVEQPAPLGVKQHLTIAKKGLIANSIVSSVDARCVCRKRKRLV
jgi:hypothetical protein